MNTIEQLVEALIARLRMMQSALGVDETCGEAADALERMEAERDALKEQMTADRKQFLDMRDERDALSAGLAAALDFVGTVAGGASWWEDVWKEHEAAISGEKT